MVQDYIKFSETLEVLKIKRVTENIKSYAQKEVQIIKSKAQKEATKIYEQTKGELAKQNIQGMNDQLKLISKNLFPGAGVNEKKNTMEFFTLLRI